MPELDGMATNNQFHKQVIHIFTDLYMPNMVFTILPLLSPRDLDISTEGFIFIPVMNCLPNVSFLKKEKS